MIAAGQERIKIVGKSSAIQRKLDFIKRIANSDKNVLILGETGTGKDLMARMIHEKGERKDTPFVALNCAHIPENLFESELFGHARGSFTGAIKDKQGLLEMAGKGTVFLDEIGDLPFYLQSKLLRIIEQRELRRIGETLFRKIQARFIFATNVALDEEVRQGKFRKDLYYRISVLKFSIPPLRERKEDIPLLVAHILERENKKWNTKKVISFNALKKLTAYDYPGNIRELENIVERAYILSGKDEIEEESIELEGEEAALKEKIRPGSDQLRQILENCRWNKTKAALEMGKSRRQLYRLLEKHEMSDCIRKN